MAGPASRSTRTDDHSCLSCSLCLSLLHIHLTFTLITSVSLLCPSLLFIFKMSVYSFLLSLPICATLCLIIHSLLTLFIPLSLCRTALGCVFGRGSGSSWLISVCSTTKVSLCPGKQYLCVMSTGPSTGRKWLKFPLTTCSSTWLFVFPASPKSYIQARTK